MKSKTTLPLLFLPFVFLSLNFVSGNAQTSLVYWNMSNGFGATVTPSSSLPMNSSKLVSAVGQTSAAFVSSLGEPTDPVFVCNGWNVGSGNAWFLINFSTTAFSGITFNFVFETYQFGPKDLKTQYSVSSASGPWSDFGSTLNYGSTGGSGSYSFLLPAACDNQSNVWVRIVTTSAPTSTGGSYMDNVEAVGATTLPIELASFSGEEVNNAIRLNWMMVNETNISDYDIERSLNGIDFSGIKNIDAKAQASYSYTDEATPKNTAVYYRLKLNYRDLRQEYSSTIRFDMKEKNTSLSIYPNPTADALVSIKLQDDLHAGSILEVTDMSGKKIVRTEISASDLKEHKVVLPMKTFAAGSYLVHVHDPVNNSKQSSSFVKQ